MSFEDGVLLCSGWDEFPEFVRHGREHGPDVETVKFEPCIDTHVQFSFQDSNFLDSVDEYLSMQWEGNDDDYDIERWTQDYPRVFHDLTKVKQLDIHVEIDIQDAAWKDLAKHGTIETLNVQCPACELLRASLCLTSGQEN